MAENSFNLQHLQAELSRLDVIVQREIRRWQLADQDPNNPLRGVQITDDDITKLQDRDFGVSWGQTVTLPESERNGFFTAETHAEHRAEAIIEQAYQENQLPRLAQLALSLNLSQFEVDTLLLCLAPAIDLGYEKFCAYLQDNVSAKQPTINMVLDLLAPQGLARLAYLVHFADEAPLFKYRVLEKIPDPGRLKPPLLRQFLRLDDAIITWLLEDYHPPTDLQYYVTLTSPEVNSADTLIAKSVQSELAELATLPSPPLFMFYGPDQASQDAAARLLAAHQNKPLFCVDLAGLSKSSLPPLALFQLILRDARLNQAIPYLTGWESLMVDNTPQANLLLELCAYSDTVIIGSANVWQPHHVARDRQFLWLEFPTPNYPQRNALWRHFLAYDQWQSHEQVTSRDLDMLAGQFVLSTMQIRDAVATARDLAAKQLSRTDLSLSHSSTDLSLFYPTRADLFSAARSNSNPRLVTLARKITPRYGWDDLILPVDLITILRELVSTVRGRPKVLDEWGLGKKLASSSGVTVLFAGPPGTGKTMAAEVIAIDLGLDLFKINLSSVVSKYIGETEKNLEKIFEEAQSSNAILFFDEADSIFGKRSEVKDARDRCANLEVSYLLQRMEAYDGVTILATNLRSNLDEAFTRRLQFALDVPFPREEHRLRIWEALFPPSVPRADDIDFGFLAQKFKFAGGSIRNVILSAAYLAAADGGCVTMEHLLHSTRRELQKMGRLVDNNDLRRPDRADNPPESMSITGSFKLGERKGRM